MGPAFGVTFVVAAGLSLVCAVIYPRTLFGILGIIAAAFFMGVTFATESKSLPALSILCVLTLGAVIAIAIRAIKRFRAGAEAEYGVGSRRSSLYATLSGPPARRFWKLQIVCSSLIAAGTIGIGAFNWKRISERADVIIGDTQYVFSKLNVDPDSDVTWPDPEIKRQAGENIWGGWRPKFGDRGKIVGELKGRYYTYYIVKIDDHYVPIRPSGVTYLY